MNNFVEVAKVKEMLESVRTREYKVCKDLTLNYVVSRKDEVRQAAFIACEKACLIGEILVKIEEIRMT